MFEEKVEKQVDDFETVQSTRGKATRMPRVPTRQWKKFDDNRFLALAAEAEEAGGNAEITVSNSGVNPSNSVADSLRASSTIGNRVERL